jgi:flagellar biosynthetic protein FliP
MAEKMISRKYLLFLWGLCRCSGAAVLISINLGLWAHAKAHAQTLPDTPPESVAADNGLQSLLAQQLGQFDGKAGSDESASADTPADFTSEGKPSIPASPAAQPVPQGASLASALSKSNIGLHQAILSGAGPKTTPSDSTAQALRVVIGLTVLAILPALLVCLTSFLRIIIVLSMLRQAIGMMETPPNTVLIGLALFLTMFTMSPVLQTVNSEAFQPFMAGKKSMEHTYQKAAAPMRDFMVRQTREQDLALMVELSRAPAPREMSDISNVQLIPAFMLSELRSAFQIGFVIFLPFLLIDLVVSSVLMALGMMMMPPTTVALPLKILMFILVDGWSLVLKGLVGSFH